MPTQKDSAAFATYRAAVGECRPSAPVGSSSNQHFTKVITDLADLKMAQTGAATSVASEIIHFDGPSCSTAGMD